MFQKIPIEDLQVGMYIANTGVSWLTHKGLCIEEGLVKTEQDLVRILESGYTDTYIDLTLCKEGSLPPKLASLLHPTPKPHDKPFYPPPPTVPLQEEIAVARLLYSDSINIAKDLMDNMRQGKLTVSPEDFQVETIIGSLNRNTDALFGLCKLRQADEYTYTHCVNVSVLGTMFARGIGLDKEAQEAIGIGGLFHDLGKALVPMTIVNAPRKLTDEEFAMMRKHPTFGYDQLLEITGVSDSLLTIVVEHHEKFDGSGYPKGLAGEQISLLATLIGIVDVFDALSSRRVYKEAMPLPKVLSILYSMRDKDFPAKLVDKFINLLGIFPLGSTVQLSDGRCGIVSGSNPSNALKPKVIVLKDKKGRSILQQEIDLTSDPALTVASAVPAATLGVDPTLILGIPKSPRK